VERSEFVFVVDIDIFASTGLSNIDLANVCDITFCILAIGKRLKTIGKCHAVVDIFYCFTFSCQPQTTRRMSGEAPPKGCSLVVAGVLPRTVLVAAEFRHLLPIAFPVASRFITIALYKGFTKKSIQSLLFLFWVWQGKPTV
jgi:hypothetical protein